MQTTEASTYHHGDLKACLIDLARQRVLAQGPEAVSLRDISREVGVSHAAAYRHFPTKEALLAVVATQGFEALTAACQAACTLHSDAPLVQLQACGLAYVQFGRRNARLLDLMFGDAGQWLENKDEDTPKSHAAAELFGVLLDVVQAGQARGDMVAQEPRTVAWACWALVHGCASLAPPESDALNKAQRHAIEQRIQWSIQSMVLGLQASGKGPQSQGAKHG
jgi:AcrR family transcriptional regulator